MMISIEESGMAFGPFDENCVYRIEKSTEYRSLQNGMKVAEFVSFDSGRNRVMVVEAKASAPSPCSPTNPERFDDYIREIEQKLCNAFDLYVRQALRKELPSGFGSADYGRLDIELVLVIRNQKREWLPPVQDALNAAVTRHVRCGKIWQCNVIVLNEVNARRYGLVA